VLDHIFLRRVTIRDDALERRARRGAMLLDPEHATGFQHAIERAQCRVE
jgi:hypothetical protein